MTSVASALLATGFQLTALSEYDKAMRLRASILRADTPEKEVATATARQRVIIGERMVMGGLAFGTVSAVCLIASMRRREPARRIVAVGALILYVFSLLILV